MLFASARVSDSRSDCAAAQSTPNPALVEVVFVWGSSHEIPASLLRARDPQRSKTMKTNFHTRLPRIHSDFSLKTLSSRLKVEALRMSLSTSLHSTCYSFDSISSTANLGVNESSAPQRGSFFVDLAARSMAPQCLKLSLNSIPSNYLPSSYAVPAVSSTRGSTPPKSLLGDRPAGWLIRLVGRPKRSGRHSLAELERAGASTGREACREPQRRYWVSLNSGGA
jgi:hypothetical protein